MPEHILIPPQYQKVQDIMEGDITWNQALVRSIFTPQIAEHILNTPILEREHERLIWNPSLTGSFSVRSAYKMMIHDRDSSGHPNSWNN